MTGAGKRFEISGFGNYDKLHRCGGKCPFNEVSESSIQDVLLIIHSVFDIDLTPLYQYPDLHTGAEGGR